MTSSSRPGDEDSGGATGAVLDVCAGRPCELQRQAPASSPWHREHVKCQRALLVE